MSREGWMIVRLAGLIYAGIAGAFAWAGYTITGLCVFTFGLLVLIVLVRRAIHAQPFESVGAPLYFDENLSAALLRSRVSTGSAARAWYTRSETHQPSASGLQTALCRHPLSRARVGLRAPTQDRAA